MTFAFKNVLSLLVSATIYSTQVASAALPVPDPDDGAINLPLGFRAIVVADNLNFARGTSNRTDVLRFLTVAPNGDIYAKFHRSGLLALSDTNSDGRADIAQNSVPTLARRSRSAETGCITPRAPAFIATNTRPASSCLRVSRRRL
jgi:hypothetical protein